MNKLVSRSLEILGQSVANVGKEYTSNITSFINDAKEVKSNITKTSTDVSDTIAKLKTTDITKRISDWFYGEENSYDAAGGDEFDPGFKVDSNDDDHAKLDGEESSKILDASSMGSITEKQTSMMLKIGRRQTEQSVANTAEIVSVVNTRTAEMITSMNNINKTLIGISERIDKIIALQSVATEEQKAEDKNSLYQDGNLSLARIFNISKQKLQETNIGSIASIFMQTLGSGGGFGPDALASLGLGLLTGRKMDALGGHSIDEIGKRFNEVVGAGIQTAMNEVINSKPFTALFGNISGFNADQNYKDIVPNHYDNKKALFDGMTRQSIVNVIPEMLEKINQSISGDSYHLDNRGQWIKGPRKNEFVEVTQASFSSASLPNKAISGAQRIFLSQQGRSVSDDDINLATKALTMAIVMQKHSDGNDKGSFSISELENNMGSYIPAAIQSLCTINNNPDHWSAVCDAICIQLSSGLMDASAFVRNVNSSLDSMKQQAAAFAQSGKQNAVQAGTLNLRMAQEQFFNQFRIKPSDTTDDTENKPTQTNDNRVKKDDKTYDLGRYGMGTYIKGIFGILNRGINVRVDKGSRSNLIYSPYDITKVDPEHVENTDNAFGEAIAQAIAGGGSDKKIYKNAAKTAISGTIDKVLGRNTEGGSGGGGLSSIISGSLLAGGLRAVGESLFKGTFKEDSKKFFSDEGKGGQFINKTKEKVSTTFNESDIGQSLVHDKRYIKAKDYLVNDLLAGLSEKVKNAIGTAGDKIGGSKIYQKGYQMTNNAMFGIDQLSATRSSKKLQNIDVKSIEDYDDRLWAARALNDFKSGNIEGALMNAENIKDEGLKNVFDKHLNKIKGINEKRLTGEAQVANGEEASIGTVIKPNQDVNDTDLNKSAQHKGIKGLIYTGFRFMGSVFKNTIGRSIKQIRFGAKSLFEGLFGGKRRDKFGDIQYDEEGNVLHDKGLLQMFITDPLKAVGGKVKDFFKDEKTRNGIASLLGLPKEFNEAFDNFMNKKQGFFGTEASFNDLLNNPFETLKSTKLGQKIVSGEKKLGAFAEKHGITEDYNKLKSEVTNFFKPGSGSLLDKFRDTSLGRGFMSSFDAVNGYKGIKREQAEQKEEAEHPTVVSKIKGIFGFLTGKTEGKDSGGPTLADIIGDSIKPLSEQEREAKKDEIKNLQNTLNNLNDANKKQDDSEESEEETEQKSQTEIEEELYLEAVEPTERVYDFLTGESGKATLGSVISDNLKPVSDTFDFFTGKGQMTFAGVLDKCLKPIVDILNNKKESVSGGETTGREETSGSTEAGANTITIDGVSADEALHVTNDSDSDDTSTGFRRPRSLDRALARQDNIDEQNAKKLEEQKNAQKEELANSAKKAAELAMGSRGLNQGTDVLSIFSGGIGDIVSGVKGIAMTQADAVFTTLGADAPSNNGIAGTVTNSVAGSAGGGGGGAAAAAQQAATQAAAQQAAGSAAGSAAGGAAGAAGGAAGGGIGMLLQLGLKEVSGLLVAIGKILGGITNIVKGLVGAVIQTALAMESFKAIRKLLNDIIVDGVKPLNDAFEDIRDALEPVADVMTDLLEELMTATNDILEVCLTSMKPLLEMLHPLISDYIVEYMEPLIEDVLIPLGVQSIKTLIPCVEIIAHQIEVGVGFLEIVVGSLLQGFGATIAALGWIAGLIPGKKADKFSESLVDGGKKLATDGSNMMKSGGSHIRSGIVGTAQVIGQMFTGTYDYNKYDEERERTSVADTNEVSLTQELGAGDVNTNTYNYSYMYGSGNSTMNQHTYGSYMNMSERGCGPVVLADAFNRRSGGNVSPLTIASSMIGAGIYDPSRGTSTGGIMMTSDSLGMPLRMGGVTQESLKKASPTNPITLLGSGTGFGTKKGNNHYVNVVGTDSTGGAYVSNPMTGRVERQSATSLALNSKLGLYGSGDEDFDYGLDRKSMRAMEKLRELTSKLTGMFTGDSSAKRAMKEAENKQKVAKMESILDQDAYAAIKQQAMEELAKSNPKRDGESDEEYLERIEYMLGSPEGQELLVKYDNGATEAALKSKSSSELSGTKSLLETGLDFVTNFYDAAKKNLSSAVGKVFGKRNASGYVKNDYMEGSFWGPTYEQKFENSDYHEQSQEAGLTGAQEAMIAAIGIHEDSAKKLTGEKSLTTVTQDVNGQTAFGIMNWIPDPQNQYVGATETKYGVTLAEQLPIMRQMYFDENPTHDRARIIDSNFNQYQEALSTVLGHSLLLSPGDPWGPVAEVDLPESMGHYVANALVPGNEWYTVDGLGKRIGTAVDAYNWMISKGWIEPPPSTSEEGVEKLYKNASLVFEAAVNKNGGYYLNADIGPTELRDGTVLNYFRPDCSGLISAMITNMGYGFAGGVPAITTYDLWQRNSQDIITENGRASDDWELLQYEPGMLQPGDIITSREHMSMYVSGNDVGYYQNRGFDGGSGRGSISNGTNIMDSAAAGTAYLDNDPDWQSKLSYTHTGGNGGDGSYPLTRILRYVGSGDSDDTPPLDQSLFDDLYSNLNNNGTSTIINKYDIKSDKQELDAILDKMGSMTFNVRAERVEELLEELIEVSKKKQQTQSSYNNDGSNVDLFQNRPIPSQIQRLAKG